MGIGMDMSAMGVEVNGKGSNIIWIWKSSTIQGTFISFKILDIHIDLPIIGLVIRLDVLKALDISMNLLHG